MQFKLQTLLTVVTLATVVCTALLVHVPWYLTSLFYIEETVGRVNRQIIHGVSAEVDDVLDSAEAALHALHTALQQGAIDIGNAAKREFLFMAHLQSHPTIAWVGFGWPDGNFFGARKLDAEHIQMVETSWNASSRSAVRRIDDYSVAQGDIWFERRHFELSDFSAVRQAWYQLALTTEEAVWSHVHALPFSPGPGIAISRKLLRNGRFIGVITVAIPLAELAAYLQMIDTGTSGAIVIVNHHKQLIAWQQPEVPPARANAALPSITEIESPVLRLLNVTLTRHRLSLADLDQVHEFLEYDALRDGRFFVTFAPLQRQDWVVITLIPESDWLAPIQRGIRQLVVALLAFVALIVFIGIVVSRWAIDKPLQRLAEQMRYIEHFELDLARRTYHSRIREVTQLSTSIAQVGRGLAAFQRYLPTDLVRTLIARGIESQPISREATLLFTDIEGFTAIGERLSPETLVDLLNDYFDVIAQPIEAHGGVILQYQGDALLAVFNIPVADSRHADQAVAAALEIQTALRSRVFAGGTELRTRMGINTGPVVAASVGSRGRVGYTVHGDAVNIAARLEAMNKRFGTQVLISQHTVDRLTRDFALAEIDEVQVRGKVQTLRVYEIARKQAA